MPERLVADKGREFPDLRVYPTPTDSTPATAPAPANTVLEPRCKRRFYLLLWHNLERMPERCVGSNRTQFAPVRVYPTPAATPTPAELHKPNRGERSHLLQRYDPDGMPERHMVSKGIQFHDLWVYTPGPPIRKLYKPRRKCRKHLL